MFWLQQKHTALAQMSKELWGQTGFEKEGRKGTKTVSVQLPEMWLEAEQVIEKVIRGYGATENTPLMFDLRRISTKS